MIGRGFFTKILFLLSFAIVLALAAASPLQAQVQVKMTEKDGRPVAEFYARGRLIGRLPQRDGETAFDARIQGLKKGLEAVLRGKTPAAGITSKAEKDKALVLSGKTPFIVLDARDGAALGATPAQLAAAWAASIRFILKNPLSFKLSAASVTAPLNGEAVIPYKGFFFGSLQFLDYDPNLVSIYGDDKKQRIIVAGHSLGRGTFRVKVEDTEIIIPFKVEERAAVIPQWMSLQVSGNPATSELVDRAFASVVQYRSDPREATTTYIGAPSPADGLSTLAQGKTRKAAIGVRFEGKGYIPAAQKVQLQVENRLYDRPSPELLYVSNKPERIRKDGYLLKRKLQPGTPMRYFFHHMNDNGQPDRFFYAALRNPGKDVARVFVSPVGAGPTSDEIFAGHQAAWSYIKHQVGKMGWYVDVKPGTVYVLEKRPAKPGQTISGMGYVHILEGGTLEFCCYGGSVPGSVDREVESHPDPAGEPRTSKGVFPAFIHLTPTHEIGDKFTFIYLGGEPYQRDVEDGHPNYGNYGASYSMNIGINNNLAEDRDAWIYFIPGGGAARGILEVDGNLMETPLVSAAQKVLLKKVRVPRTQTQNVKIVIIPQGGSFYPVKIVVESEYLKK